MKSQMVEHSTPFGTEVPTPSERAVVAWVQLISTVADAHSLIDNMALGETIDSASYRQAWSSEQFSWNSIKEPVEKDKYSI